MWVIHVFGPILVFFCVKKGEGGVLLSIKTAFWLVEKSKWGEKHKHGCSWQFLTFWNTQVHFITKKFFVIMTPVFSAPGAKLKDQPHKRSYSTMISTAKLCTGPTNNHAVHLRSTSQHRYTFSFLGASYEQVRYVEPKARAFSFYPSKSP